VLSGRRFLITLRGDASAECGQPASTDNGDDTSSKCNCRRVAGTHLIGHGPRRLPRRQPYNARSERRTVTEAWPSLETQASSSSTRSRRWRSRWPSSSKQRFCKYSVFGILTRPRPLLPPIRDLLGNLRSHAIPYWYIPCPRPLPLVPADRLLARKVLSGIRVFSKVNISSCYQHAPWHKITGRLSTNEC